MAQTSLVFLAGRILLPSLMVQSWLSIIDKMVPLASGELQTQLLDCQSHLNTLLNAPVDPTVAVGSIITPISLVNDLKNTLNVWDHEFNGFVGNPNLYSDVRNETDSVYIQYSSFYFNGGIGKLCIY